MQLQQLAQHMHLMQEQMKLIVSANVASIGPAASPVAAAGDFAPAKKQDAARSLGFDEMELSEARSTAWGNALLKVPDERLGGREWAVIRSTGAECRNKIHSLMSAEARVEKLTMDVAELAQNKVLAGYKLFKLNFENVAWDEKSPLAGKKIELSFPADLTHAEARERLRFFNLQWEAKINGMMETVRRDAEHFAQC